MGISYKETEHFCTINRPTFKSLISQIDEIVMNGRDTKNIPIYLTNYRIKSIGSLYLKTKRHQETELMNITDCVGYRILCMFEQDIYDIHEFILANLKPHFTIVEFIIYNYNDQLLIESIEAIFTKIFPGVHPKNKTKDSGYKSLHYIFKQHRQGNDYYVEIQLRTLLQDVWAELEHNLAYKQGNIHPHIKKSFELLARDLEIKDSLISHLRSISDKERVGQLYVLEKGGPIEYYAYEPELIPDLFASAPHQSNFNAYQEYMGRLDLPRSKQSSIIETMILYDALRNNITMPMQADINLNYFLNMEDAFLYFWEGGRDNLDKALEIYKLMSENILFKSHYILYFRMGEIYFIKGEIVDALKSFDHCEDILTKHEIDHLNHFRVKIKLSFIYWILGQQYADLSLKMIYDAEKIFQKHKEAFRDLERVKELILNNLCSYHLEKFIKTQDDKDLEELKTKLKDFESFIKTRELNANAADSLAWTYYHIFKKDKDPQKLETAKSYCQLIDESINYSTFKITSIAIHKNHIQEIMSTK